MNEKPTPRASPRWFGKLSALLGVLASLQQVTGFPAVSRPVSAHRCTGKADCRACTNCDRCAYCSDDDRTCGACRE